MELTSRTTVARGGLRGMVHATSFGWGALMLALAALAGMPEVLVLLALIALGGGYCALMSALRPWSGAVLRAGRLLLGLLFGLAILCFLGASGDWVHVLWSVQFPLLGLFLGVGLLLVGVWREDRDEAPALVRGWKGAALALAGLALLSALPVLLAVLPFETRPASRDGGSTPAMLFEVARYGFGGEVPASMQPHGEAGTQVARGLGIPARNVTVTMGCTLYAAAFWILFAALALIGRTIRSASWRRRFLLVAPIPIALTTFLYLGSGLEDALWSNEPWLVRAYGPTLLAAAAAALALFVAIRRDVRRGLSGR